MSALKAFAMAGAMMWSGSVGGEEEAAPVYALNDGFNGVIPVLASAPQDIPFDSNLFIQYGAETNVPFGRADFCVNFNECNHSALTAEVVSAAMIPYVTTFNAMANYNIRGVADQSLYGKPEHWTMPITLFDRMYGDCEDIVLYKMSVMESMGIPRAAMSIALVMQKNGEGHAVLILRTEQGDLVLDNLSHELKYPGQTPYRFIKASSWTNDSTWQTIEILPESVVSASLGP